MQGYGAKPEYAYAALTAGKYCSCGNMPPKEERFSQCRIPCDGAPDEYCGGYDDQASWFSTGYGPESEYLYRIDYTRVLNPQTCLEEPSRRSGSRVRFTSQIHRAF